MLGALPSLAAAADGAPIDTGDTAWMLISTALVMVMLPGLALFYGGLVRRKRAKPLIAAVHSAAFAGGFHSMLAPAGSCTAKSGAQHAANYEPLDYRYNCPHCLKGS